MCYIHVRAVTNRSIHSNIETIERNVTVALLWTFSLCLCAHISWNTKVAAFAFFLFLYFRQHCWRRFQDVFVFGFRHLSLGWHHSSCPRREGSGISTWRQPLGEHEGTCWGAAFKGPHCDCHSTCRQLVHQWNVSTLQHCNSGYCRRCKWGLFSSLCRWSY